MLIVNKPNPMSKLWGLIGIAPFGLSNLKWLFLARINCTVPIVVKVAPVINTKALLLTCFLAINLFCGFDEADSKGRQQLFAERF